MMLSGLSHDDQLRMLGIHDDDVDVDEILARDAVPNRRKMNSQVVSTVPLDRVQKQVESHARAVAPANIRAVEHKDLFAERTFAELTIDPDNLGRRTGKTWEMLAAEQKDAVAQLVIDDDDNAAEEKVERNLMQSGLCDVEAIARAAARANMRTHDEDCDVEAICVKNMRAAENKDIFARVSIDELRRLGVHDEEMLARDDVDEMMDEMIAHADNMRAVEHKDLFAELRIDDDDNAAEEKVERNLYRRSMNSRAMNSQLFSIGDARQTPAIRLARAASGTSAASAAGTARAIRTASPASASMLQWNVISHCPQNTIYKLPTAGKNMNPVASKVSMGFLIALNEKKGLYRCRVPQGLWWCDHQQCKEYHQEWKDEHSFVLDDDFEEQGHPERNPYHRVISSRALRGAHKQSTIRPVSDEKKVKTKSQPKHVLQPAKIVDPEIWQHPQTVGRIRPTPDQVKKDNADRRVPCRYKEKCQSLCKFTCDGWHTSKSVKRFTRRLPDSAPRALFERALAYVNKYHPHLVPYLVKRFPKLAAVVDAEKIAALQNKEKRLMVSTNPCKYGQQCKKLATLECRFFHVDEDILRLPIKFWCSRHLESTLREHGRNYFGHRWELWNELMLKTITKDDNEKWDEILCAEAPRHSHLARPVAEWRGKHVVRYMFSSEKLFGVSATWPLLPPLQQLVLEYLGVVEIKKKEDKNVVVKLEVSPDIRAIDKVVQMCYSCGKQKHDMKCFMCGETAYLQTNAGVPWCETCMFKTGLYAKTELASMPWKHEQPIGFEALEAYVGKMGQRMQMKVVAEACLSVLGKHLGKPRNQQQQQQQQQMAVADEYPVNSRSEWIKMYALDAYPMRELDPTKFCSYVLRDVVDNRLKYSLADALNHCEAPYGCVGCGGGLQYCQDKIIGIPSPERLVFVHARENCVALIGAKLDQFHKSSMCAPFSKV
jgi:hypothetical protein